MRRGWAVTSARSPERWSVSSAWLGSRTPPKGGWVDDAGLDRLPCSPARPHPSPLAPANSNRPRRVAEHRVIDRSRPAGRHFWKVGGERRVGAVPALRAADWTWRLSAARQGQGRPAGRRPSSGCFSGMRPRRPRGTTRLLLRA